MARGVEVETAEPHDVVRDLGRAAAQDGLDARVQLAGRERLRDVVVGAGLEAGQLVLLFRAGRQHDDRDLLRPAVGPEAARELDAGDAGQHPVEQDEIGECGLDDVHGLFGVVRLEQVVACLLQVVGDQFLNRRFVFDDQNRRGHGGSP